MKQLSELTLQPFIFGFVLEGMIGRGRRLPQRSTHPDCTDTHCEVYTSQLTL